MTHSRLGIVSAAAAARPHTKTHPPGCPPVADAVVLELVGLLSSMPALDLAMT